MNIIGARDWIPNIKELQALLPSSSSSASKPSKDWRSKCTYVSTILPIKLHIATSSNLRLVMLTFSSQEEAKGSINVDALLDTGCLAGDLVARRIVDKYNIKPVLQSTAKVSVCSGLDITCYDISRSVIIRVYYSNERMNNMNTFEINAINLDSSPLDLIIGRTIKKKFGFVHQVPKYRKSAYNRG